MHETLVFVATGLGKSEFSRIERTLAVQPAAASFIDLGSLAGSRRDAGNSLELRLDLGGGVVLQIVRR